MTSYSKKSIARNYAFKFLYKLQMEEFQSLREQLLSNNEKFEEILTEFDQSYVEKDEEHPRNDLSPKSKELGDALIKGVLEKKVELESLISPRLKKSFNSLNKIDATILLIATYELVSNANAPKIVIINEAIEMAKLYGTADTSKFVNAVLDAIVKGL